LRTSIFTTDGLTCSAAMTTALEYASSNGPSETGPLCAADWPFNASGSFAPGDAPNSFSAILMTMIPF